jgi:hypothetical protein
MIAQEMSALRYHSLIPSLTTTATLLTLSYLQSKKCHCPLEVIDPNVQSLQSATAAAVAAPATLTRSAYPVLLLRPLPSHIPIQEPRHTTDAAIGNNALAWASGH